MRRTIEMIEVIRETDEGFDVVTNKQVIKMGISQGQCCCENYGYFMSNDNVSEFEGAILYDVKIVDDCFNVERLKEVQGYEGQTMFVNLETSKGTLQFVVYNYHNGYYSHAAWVHSEQLTEDTYL